IRLSSAYFALHDCVSVRKPFVWGKAVECPNCKASVPQSAKFCAECGSALSRKCPACGSDSPPSAKFCPECGASLDAKMVAAPKSEPAARAPAQSASPERRQLTIMFCDMVGSSALSTRLDPEEQREVVSAFQSCCAADIKRLG